MHWIEQCHAVYFSNLCCSMRGCSHHLSPTAGMLCRSVAVRCPRWFNDSLKSITSHSSSTCFANNIYHKAMLNCSPWLNQYLRFFKIDMKDFYSYYVSILSPLRWLYINNRYCRSYPGWMIAEHSAYYY